GEIASGALAGASAVGSGVVTLVLVLVLVFFFLKDGPDFLLFVRRVSGARAVAHVTEVATRSWNTLSGFIRTQALVPTVHAVLVALVAQGPMTALVVLVLIVAVQQIEGNVLQPFLQGRSMELHAGVILLAVAVGSTVFGIVGAFLAVPVAAVGAVILRYLSEQADLRAGVVRAEEAHPDTGEGRTTADRAAQMADDAAA